ncbi:MAG: hypothetical protein RI885_1599 [Actinomycetota bacterium]
MSAPQTPTTRAVESETTGSPARLTGWAAVAGFVSAVVTLAVAEVLALLIGGGNPLLAVGSLIVDLAPPGLKDLVISLFDTANKLVLFLCLGVLVSVLAVGAGILELRRPPLGRVAIGLVAAVAVVAAVTRADAGVLAALPTVGGAAGGILMLRVLLRRLRAWRDARPRTTGPATAWTPPGVSLTSRIAPTSRGTEYERRGFLRLVVAVGVTSAVVGVGARVLSAARAAASDVREMLTLPPPGEATAALTEAQDVALDGLSTFVTPNDEFYRIDTALQVPAVDAASWTLRIVGMVEEEVEIGFDELLALPLVERYITLACVSQEVGGGLIGNARWLGFPIRELLARARPTADADMVLSRSVDGFTASTPLEVLQDPATDSLLAVGMNGEPLPLDHGFPVRMVVPGLYGYVSATKWVTELRVTTFADDLAYWSTRGWTERGPVKLSSRIDTPPDRRRIEPGPTKIAGVAWAQHTGVSAVEVRIDDGRWQQASLADEVSVDAWLQWWFDWDAASGSHTIEVRATDADGLVQTADLAPPAPDGSTGHHTITVRVD